MTVALGVILAVALLGAVGSGIMYYAALHHFSQVLGRNHPQLLEATQAELVLPRSRLSLAYRILRGAKNGRLGGIAFSPEAQAAWSSANRLLYVSVSLVFTAIVVFLGLDLLLGD